MLKLILIDDHFVVRSGLVASLELEDDMSVLAEADRGEEASTLFAKHQPDVVLMDMQLPGISGVEATARLRAAHPEARVLIFSTFARDEEVAAALKAGALGYLQKSASRDELLKAIDEVNDVYFNAEEKLATAIKNHVKIITGDMDSSTVFLREWRRLPEDKITDFIKLRNKYEEGFTQILINGENENVFDAPDKKFAVLTILSAVNWITEWYSPKGSMTPDEISEHLYKFITNGLKVKTLA